MDTWETPVTVLLLHFRRGSLIFLQRAQGRVYFGTLTFRYIAMRTYGVNQFHNYRGDRDYAKIWSSISWVLLP